jgi:hypothetical protein
MALNPVHRNPYPLSYSQRMRESEAKESLKNATTIQIRTPEDEEVFGALLKTVEGDFLAATQLELADIKVHFKTWPADPLPLLLANRMPLLTRLKVGHFSTDYSEVNDSVAPWRIFGTLLSIRKFEELTFAGLQLSVEGCAWLVNTLKNYEGLKALALDRCSGSIHVMWSGDDPAPNFENVMNALEVLGRFEGLGEDAQASLITETALECEMAARGGIDCIGQIPFTEEQLATLMDLPSLEKLDLSGCKFVDSLLEPALKQSLPGNTHLQTMCLQGNVLKGPGLQALADALRQNKTLTSLSFTWNGTDRELEPLVTALEANHTLQGLLIECTAPGENCKKLMTLVARNQREQMELQARVATLVLGEART